VLSHAEGECDAMEYEEALGLNLTAAHEDDAMTAHRVP
jgi:hypothetical protein